MHVVSSNMTNDDPSEASGGLITCHKPTLTSCTGQTQSEGPGGPGKLPRPGEVHETLQG